jgi:hypothetical protein
MQIYILHMINKFRSYLFDLYVELLYYIQRHTSAEQRVLLPGSVVPESGSRRIPPETASFQSLSARFHEFSRGNPRENRRKVEAVFRTGFPRT